MGKTIFTVLLIVIGISILGFALRVILLPARIAGNTLETIEGTIDKTLTADNAIYNYEWFKQQAENIKATEAKVLTAEATVDEFELSAGERVNWTFEDKTEHARLNTVKQGLMNYLEDQIATYNARAKMANRNIFQDGFIPSAFEIGSNLLR